VVRMFLAEKGITVPMEDVDLMKGDNRREPYLSRNSIGQMPALELDGGHCVTEITAICEYLEDIHPEPPLIGNTPEKKAETRKWTRRVDLNICEPLVAAFRFSAGLKLFQDRIPTIPEAADGLKRVAQHYLKWLDGEMAGKEFICGKRFTLADILLFCFLDFGATVGQPIDPNLKNVAACLARLKERPSAKA
jgi:glutathione S-transferase